MGNEVSSVAALQDQLAELERAVSAQQHRAQVREHPLLPHELHIDGAVVTTRADVRVLVGPVVGRVECDSARVLLEVDVDARVTCHVSVLNTLSGDMHELTHASASLHCAAGKPIVFALQRLVPGRAYSIAFSGICKQDALARRGGFHTPSLERGSSISAVAVSSDSVYDLAHSGSSRWRDVRKRIEAQTAHVVLHLGGQVRLARLFDQSCALLLRYTVSTTAIDWRDVEQRATELLRAAYRTQWSASLDVRYVLAHASNLMIWSDADVYPAFTTRSEFVIDHEQPTIQMQIVRTVTRCARQLYHEYQRQLWDDDIDALFIRERELVAVAERALATTVQIYQLTQQLVVAQRELELQKKRREIEAARRVEQHVRALNADKVRAERQLVSFRELLAPQRGEEFVYCVGAIGVLFLDVRSARLEPGGSQAAANDLLSNAQWQFIEDALASNTVQLWAVCSELPLLDAATAAHDSTIDNDSDAPSRWGNNPEAQTRLLELLFDWKMAQADREFVLLAGASTLGFGAATTVRDTKMRTRAEQFVTGAITAASSVPSTASDAFAVRQLRAVSKRFHIEHRNVVLDRAFLTLELAARLARTDSGARSSADTATADGSKRIAVAHVSGSSDTHALARVLLGPVVGFVDASSACVLLEVDRDADIICTALNPLTGETRRLHQRLRARTPSTFYWTHLRAAHYYELAFSNVQHAERVCASFSTPARYPTRFELLVLCNDDLLRADALGGVSNDASVSTDTAYSTTQLWDAVADKVAAVPFASVNLTLHLGGQFSTHSNAFIDDAVALADAALSTTVAAGDTEQSRRAIAVDIVTEKLRQMYRLAWSLPGVRDALAHGAHVLLSNSDDNVLRDASAASSADLLVHETLVRMHSEYQQLLLPPSKRSGCGHALSIAFGTIGLFVLPVVAHGGVAVHAPCWTELQTFLSTPGLSVLLLVTHAPVVEHASEDVVERARFDAASAQAFAYYERELLQLLSLLFAWKQSSSSSMRPREVVLVSGSRTHSFDSVIQEHAVAAPPLPLPPLSTRLDPPLTSARRGSEVPVLLQYVVGPMSSTIRHDGDSAVAAFDRLTRFDQGTLGRRYAYRHFVAKRASGRHVSESNGETVTHDARATDDDDASTSSQLAYLVIDVADSVAASRLQSCEPLHELPKPAATTTRWTLVSCDALDLPVTDNTLDRDVATRYERVGRVVTRHVNAAGDTWELHPEQPQWLDKLLSEALDSDEREQVDAIRASLHDRIDVVRESFEHVATLKSGLVTLRDARAFVPPLTEALAAFYALSGAAFRASAGAVPSPFVISYSVEQLRQSEHDAAERSATLGSVDVDVYALLLERCVANALVFQRRLEKHWA